MRQTDYKHDNPYLIIIRYFKPHMKLFILDMICALIYAGIELVYPMVTRKALNEMIPAQAYKVFFTVIFAMVVAYFIKAILKFIITYWGHTFGVRVEADIREDLFKKIQTLGYDFFDNNRTGHIMSRLTHDLNEITELAHHGPENLFIASITLVGSIIMMCSIEWHLAAVIAVLVPLFIIVVAARRKHMNAVSVMVKVRTAEINAEVETSLAGIRTAKAFANEEIEKEKFMKANAAFRNSKKDHHKEMGIFQSLMDYLTSVLSVVVIGVGGYLIMTSKINYADLITFSLYTSSFISPIRTLAGFSEQLVTGMAGVNRFIEIMATNPSIVDKDDAKELKDVVGNIDIESVSFAYRENIDVLTDLSVNIKPGETIAIVGPSGGGKTTLCQLIPRFYDVNTGSIKIDGNDVRDLTQNSIHKNIGIVQQDVFLFAATVRDNIAYGRPGATEEEIIEAAKKAEIYEDILQMPNGLDTYVGERGTLLSGGQKQRIAIARIFLKNPPILILDEATSALDTITEAKIQSAFDALAVGRTTLIIAHRLSTIRNASRIVVISDGKLVEEGTHAQLMEKDGIYANLYNTQTKLHG